MAISVGALNALRSDVQYKQAVVEAYTDAIDKWLSKIKPGDPQEEIVTTIAANLARFYTAVEDILEQILRVFDDFDSDGGSWHKSLLVSALTGKNNRPPIISEQTFKLLDSLRGFRHVFHKAYTEPIRWDKMRDLVSSIKTVLEDFAADLAVFDSFLEQSIEMLAQHRL